MSKDIELNVGADRQLLFDRKFIARSRGIKLKMNQPYQDCQPLLVPDQPWERSIGAYNSVVLTDGVYRMWYDVSASGSGKRRVLCYAESADGVNWRKPSIGLIEFAGSKKNNIVAPCAPGASMGGAAVFHDPQAPAHERWKLWTKYYRNKSEIRSGMKPGLWAMVSPDGLQWSMLHEGYPLFDTGADSHNMSFWDEHAGRYVGFIRMKKHATQTRQRDCSVGLIESTDFRNWSRPRAVFRADEDIAIPPGVDMPGPFVDLYTPVGMKVPGVADAYVLMPTPYYHWGRPPTGHAHGFPATIDVALATSRDRVKWWQPPRSEREPFLRHSFDDTAASGMIFSSPWLIPAGNELWFYYVGVGRTHTQKLTRPRTGIYRARIRRDGFVSVDASPAGGEFTTPLLTFKGTKLKLNLDGSAGGWLQVELQDKAGKPINGFTQRDCDVLRGNAIDRTVTWKSSADLTRLKGKAIRIRFVMAGMKLYALQFTR